MSEIRNAQITNASLTIEDHGILTFHITLKMAGGGCCIGGYALDQGFPARREGEDDVRISTPAGLDCMRQIMEVVGVKSWEDLKGKYIRYIDNGLGHSIDTIGNIIDEKWINIAEFFANYDLERNCRTISQGIIARKKGE